MSKQNKQVKEEQKPKQNKQEKKQIVNQDKKEEPKQKKQEQPPKQLRRIAERGQMPADKSQLIQYLSNRIKEAEDALIDTEQLLDSQIKQRQKLTKSLEQRNKQLNKLYEVDQRALPQKIKEKLNDILSETVTQKVEAEEKLQEQKLKNYQYKARYGQLKWEDKNNKVKLEQQDKKEEDLAKDLSALEGQNKTQEDELQALEVQYSELREKKQSLENKYLQLKVALERMSDIKGVLNRFFSNEDLWDQKMELKEQKVQRLPQVAKQLPPSREKSRHTNSRLRPIVKPTRNDDDDFWRADLKSKF